MDKKEKIPTPPNMKLPMSFWANIIKTVDYKITEISALTGFGSVEITMKVWNGEVSDVAIRDEAQFRVNRKTKKDTQKNDTYPWNKRGSLTEKK